MTAVNALSKSNPVFTYYVLVFSLSWGGMVLVGGPNIFAGTSWQTDPLFMSAILMMLAGPPVAGILMSVLVSGKDGLRGLLSRLLKGRVAARWYAVALLTAPLLQSAVLLALSQISPIFLPAIATTADKASLLLSGISMGLVGGFVEELGWTGFAIPKLRVRHSVLATGLVVGVLWGAWHLFQMLWVASTSSEAIPLKLFLPQFFFTATAQLTAYRVLMVWVYDRVGSLLMAVLMHASYIFSTLFVLAPPTTGVPFLTYSWVFAVALWIVIAVVYRSSALWKRNTHYEK
jgi:uncharacterized protein